MGKAKDKKSDRKAEKAEKKSHESDDIKSRTKRSKKGNATEDTPEAHITTKGFLTAKASFDPLLESLFTASNGPVSTSRPQLSSLIAPKIAESPETSEDEEVPETITHALAASRDALNKEKKKKRKRANAADFFEDEYMNKLHDDGDKDDDLRKKKKSKSEVVGKGDHEKEDKVVKKSRKEKEEGHDKKKKLEKKDKKGKKDKKNEMIVSSDDAAHVEGQKAIINGHSANEDDDEQEGVVASSAAIPDVEMLNGADENEDSSDGEEEEDDDDDAEGEQGEDAEDSSEADDNSETSDKDKATTPPPKHESLSAKDNELDKATRTIFIGNLPSTLITDKTQSRTLKEAFKSHGPIESIRYRSIAFSDQIPRKAAYLTKALHAEQKTINAYIVYKTASAARASLALNGTILLDRHIRVDSIAHPAKQDAKRCVFVGNLDFEASEEQLWKHFSQCGQVDNVRVVRDSKTNVGKGIAYVSFDDVMSVDQALLLDGQKMVDDKHKRKLRITRAKTMRKKPSSSASSSTARVGGKAISTGKMPIYVPKADPKKSGMLGRAGKLLGRAGAAKMKRPAIGKGEIFEGTRAVPGMDTGLKKGGTGKKKGKPRARAQARTTAWKQKQKGGTT